MLKIKNKQIITLYLAISHLVFITVINNFIFLVVKIINNINKAVIEENVDSLTLLLKSPCLKPLSVFHKEEAHLYMKTLKKVLQQKSSQNLWYEDIVNAINDVNTEAVKVKELMEAIVQLNLAVLKNDVIEFWRALSDPNLSKSAIMESSCRDIYFQMFSKALKKKGQNICPWIVCHTESGNAVYIDVESYTYSWATPKDFVPYPRYLTRKEINSIIEKTNKHHVNVFRQKLLEKSITKFQAYCRGYLLRQIYNRMKYFQENIHYVIAIQSWWRGIVVQRRYSTLLKMKYIEAKLKREKKQNPWAWYKIQVQFILLIFCVFIFVTYFLFLLCTVS